MRIIPVLDVMNGAVVRAVGGRRSEYQPIVSRLTDSTEPLAVAKSLLAATGASELYIADLDAIQGGPDQLSQIHHLSLETRAEIWTDYGYKSCEDWTRVPNGWIPGIKPVIGSETVADLNAFHCGALAWMPFFAFSLDLRGGVLLSDMSAPQTRNTRRALSALELIAEVNIDDTLPTLIVIDLASVGEKGGPTTTELCRRIKKAHPRPELLVGGGIRNRDDMRRLEDAGADGVLVASALHDGTLS